MGRLGLTPGLGVLDAPGDVHPDHLDPGIADPDSFNERVGEIYWISVVAENRHFFDENSWDAIDMGDEVYQDTNSGHYF